MLANEAAAAWAELAAARTLTLATRGPDGAPRLRMVVPRGVDPPARQVRFYTDRRSAKVSEMAAEPRVALLAWDPAARVQLRLDGIARLGEAAVEDAPWTGLRPGGYLDYATALAPGDAAPGPVARLDPHAARAHFAVVDVTIEVIERLRLDEAGHERVRYTWRPDGWTAAILVP